jgi:lipopolysaccharide transport system ATP-binding protein
MGDLAIRVTGLGKRYRLHHEARAGRYRTLREDIIQLPRRIWSKMRGGKDEEFWALKDISFEVKPGEIVGVIGRNGAGKSTLLKILSRITPPTVGEVDLFGRVGSLLEVGTGFHPELTGRENIYLSGALLGMRRPEIRRRFDEIVAFAGVEKFLDTPCKHYSSGMYLRLGFAVAAHLDAEILLVDEVLAVGDVAFQRKCLDRMGRVTENGRTVVLVSHDLGVIRRLARQCIWIDAGALARIGSTGEVIGEYLDASFWQNNQSRKDVSFERGTRNIWFSSARLSGSAEGGNISMGDTVTLAFEVQADPASGLRPVCFAIGVRTEEGVSVGLVVDVDSGFRVAQGVGSSMRISVRFSHLMLYPGRYFLRLWAGSHDGNETYDDRQDCLVLYIADTGQVSQRRLLRSQGVLFLQPDWTIEK